MTMTNNKYKLSGSGHSALLPLMLLVTMVTMLRMGDAAPAPAPWDSDSRKVLEHNLQELLQEVKVAQWELRLEGCPMPSDLSVLKPLLAKHAERTPDGKLNINALRMKLIYHRFEADIYLADLYHCLRARDPTRYLPFHRYFPYLQIIDSRTGKAIDPESTHLFHQGRRHGRRHGRRSRRSRRHLRVDVEDGDDAAAAANDVSNYDDDFFRHISPFSANVRPLFYGGGDSSSSRDVSNDVDNDVSSSSDVSDDDDDDVSSSSHDDSGDVNDVFRWGDFDENGYDGDA